MSREVYRRLVPRWTELALHLPRPLATLLIVLVGFVRTVHGLARWERAHAVAMIASGMGTSRRQALATFLLAEINVARSHVDFAELASRSPAQVRDWARANCAAEGLEGLRSATARRIPVIILVTSFAPHYIGFLSPAVATLGAAPVAVVQPAEALEALDAIGFYPRLSEAIGRQIQTIPADNPFALVQSMKALAAGAVVAMRVDSLPVRTNSFLVSSLFGRPSAFPASILQLAARAGAVLIPLFVIRRDRGFLASFGEGVRVPQTMGNREMVAAAGAINAQIEAALLRAPHSYSSWYGLYEKRRLAEEVLAQMDDTP